MLSRFVIGFSYKEQVSFNFMAAFTICSDFGAQNILIILDYLLWRGKIMFNLTKFIHIISSTWRYNLLHRLPPIITVQTRIPGIIEKASKMKHDTILDISSIYKLTLWFNSVKFLLNYPNKHLFVLSE